MNFPRRTETVVRLAAGLMLFTVVGVAPGLAVAEPAGNSNTYAISAQGASLSITVEDATLPLFPVVSLSPYGASASADSVGDSMADAGLPYSPVVFSLPGTVNGLGAGGLLPPLPPLPGYVHSSYPTQSTDKQSQGPYLLNSTSSQYSSKGEVQLGGQTPGSDTSTFFATAQTTANSDGSVSASASAGVDLLGLGDLFDLGRVSSTAAMTMTANGKPTFTSTTNLGTITLLGKLTGLTNTGLYILGQHTKMSLTTTLLPTLNTLLSARGITLSYLPVTYVYTDGSTGSGAQDANKTVESIDSGALQIVVKEDVKTQGVVTTTLVLGRTTLSTTDTPGSIYTPPTSGGTGGGTVPVTTPSAPPVVAGNNGGVTVPTGPSSPPVAASPPATTGSSSQPVAQIALVSRARPTSATQGLFLILVLGGLAVLGASQFVRLLGVRLQLSGGSIPPPSR